jgi:hypothetical protein
MAQVQANGVALNWTTGAELNTLGFQIWRSADGQRQNAVQVSGLIAHQGSPTTGANYAYVDTSAQAKVQYTYWVQVVHSDQSSEDLGSASLQLTGVVYLPLVSR